MTLAVIKTGGKQYVVSAKDKLRIEKLKVDEGKTIDFKEVLMVSDKTGKDLKVGDPLVKGAKVSAKVLKQGKSKKVTGYHYKAKVRQQKKFGHRQYFTEVEISSITA